MPRRNERHYHLDICIYEDEIKIIKEDFPKYLDEMDEGFEVNVADKDDIMSDELNRVIKELFLRLLRTIEVGRFHGGLH